MSNCQSPSRFLPSLSNKHWQIKGLVFTVYTCSLLISAARQPLHVLTPPCMHVQTGTCIYVTRLLGYLRSSAGIKPAELLSVLLSKHLSVFLTFSTQPTYKTWCLSIRNNHQAQNLSTSGHLHHLEPTLATINSCLGSVSAPAWLSQLRFPSV